MKKRSPLLVLVNCLWTFGIFAMLWFIQTKRDMNERGEHIPSAWWMIVPGVNLWWYWKYAEAFSRVTARAHNRISPVVVFLLQLFVPLIAPPILQDIINSASDVEDAEQLARARVVS